MVLKISGIPGLELRQQRCQDYWLMYLQLAEKTMVFSETQKAGVNTIQLEQDVRTVQSGIDQHLSCCKQCHDWFLSFSKWE
jgi:hypothetical protein